MKDESGTHRESLGGTFKSRWILPTRRIDRYQGKRQAIGTNLSFENNLFVFFKNFSNKYLIFFLTTFCSNLALIELKLMAT